MSMMAAVWLTVLLVHAARRNAAWWWLAYGAVLATSALLDVYLVLLWVVHAGFVALFRRSTTVLVRFTIASVLTFCAMAPFVAVVVGQVHQISWITPIGRRTFEDVAVQQYFDRNPAFAIVSALVVAAAVVLWLSRVRRLAVQIGSC